MIDRTHDLKLKSWVTSAHGSEFPIQNLPFGIFSTAADKTLRGGVAIGDYVLDLKMLAAADRLSADAQAAATFASASTLNDFLAAGRKPRQALRLALSTLLSDAAARSWVEPCLHPIAACSLHLPCRIGDYTDFFAGLHHARKAGQIMRPGSDLAANYKYVPIGYHGRASSIRPSSTAVRRPLGQTLLPGQSAPAFGPSRKLDFELELGVWVGEGNTLGEAAPIADAGRRIAGLCLLNDWSARDIQMWEAQPLGPFLAKNFQTTISPWIVTVEALAPFRVAQEPRAPGDPAPLPHLLDANDQAHGALALDLEVLIQSAAMRADGIAPHRIVRSAARHLYWTPAQLLAHHTSGGCNLAPGDLLGTGTISAPADDGGGALLELTNGGVDLLRLPSGEARGFLEDGDEIFLRATARREGYAPIGFGECRGVISPSRSTP